MPQLSRRIRALVADPVQRDRLESSLADLDAAHAVLAKWEAEPGLSEILEELYSRLISSFGSPSAVKGLRILDIACGSNSSRAPVQFHLRTSRGRQPIVSPTGDDFAAVFEPWFCRILQTLEADAVGVDQGDLSGETFEVHLLDLGMPGALDLFGSGTFDAVQDSRLFGSPEFRVQFPASDDRLAVAEEIVRQEARLLKPGGIVIHSDAAALVSRSGDQRKSSRIRHVPNT